MIAIDKNVPLTKTTRKSHGGQPSKYPWTQMQVGDSFFVAGKTVKSFSGNTYSAGKRLGQKYSVRSVDGGIRVWRTT